MNNNNILNVSEDLSIKRHQVASRLTSVIHNLMKYFAKNRCLITCVGNIGAGKSSLIKVLAYNTAMNAMFELPDEEFEDYFVNNDSFAPLLATVKDSAKRTLGRYYNAINEFIECQSKENASSPTLMIAKRNLEKSALDIQHAYMDLRKMQLQAAAGLSCSTCIDGSSFADRFAFSEVLHRDMDVPYLTEEALAIIDKRLESEFKQLIQPNLLILIEGPLNSFFQNIRERQRSEEKSAGSNDDIPEGLSRLVAALNTRYSNFIKTLHDTSWYKGSVLRIDISKIDFVANIRHLIAVYEGIERLLLQS